MHATFRPAVILLGIAALFASSIAQAQWVMLARHVLTDRRAYLDDRLVHLALHLLAERPRAGRKEFRDVRTELPRLGIDNLKFFLNADGEPMRHQ